MSKAKVPWGFFAHRKINELAIYTLPPDLQAFFKSHKDLLIKGSVRPDQRRYSDPREAPKHYIDLDAYPEDSIQGLQGDFQLVLKKHGKNKIMAHGILPWVLDSLTNKLTWAFREKEANLILKCAADLGHYLGDAAVPLHTTENYDGQLTGQEGIHALWESSIPEYLFDNWDTWTGPARYLKDTRVVFWDLILSSHFAVDSVLLFEKKTSDAFQGKTRTLQQRGKSMQLVFSESFCSSYFHALDGMPEKRLVKVISLVGSVWTTCWVNAGQPDLSGMRPDKEPETTPLEPSEPLRMHE